MHEPGAVHAEADLEALIVGRRVDVPSELPPKLWLPMRFASSCKGAGRSNKWHCCCGFPAARLGRADKVICGSARGLSARDVSRVENLDDSFSNAMRERPVLRTRDCVERLVTGQLARRLRDFTAQPSLEQLKVYAAEDALALLVGDREPTGIEHVQYVRGSARGATLRAPLFERAALPTAHEFFGSGMHFERLFCRVTKGGFDESYV